MSTAQMKGVDVAPLNGAANGTGRDAKNISDFRQGKTVFWRQHKQGDAVSRRGTQGHSQFMMKGAEIFLRQKGLFRVQMGQSNRFLHIR
jgi:hypothetical protein